MDMLLYNAIIVTVNPERETLYNGAMAVDKGRIVELGDSAELSKKYADAAKKIDCEGKIIFPGFINTHNHLFQSLLKGLVSLLQDLWQLLADKETGLPALASRLLSLAGSALAALPA